MDGFAAAAVLNAFFKVLEGRAGSAVVELVTLNLPGSEILLAAEVVGVDIFSDSRSATAIRKDPSLQRYLNKEIEVDLDNHQDSYLEASNSMSSITVTCAVCGKHSVEVPTRKGTYRVKCPDPWDYSFRDGKCTVVKVFDDGSVKTFQGSCLE